MMDYEETWLSWIMFGVVCLFALALVAWHVLMVQGV